ncbi:hypothetical protein D3C75_1100310 [compost metagenome]
MRQNVLARRFASSIAAITRATRTCGTVESRKMLRVLRREFQKNFWPRTNVKLSNPTKSPLPPIRLHSCIDTYAVYSSGKRPTIANRMKNGEMYR